MNVKIGGYFRPVRMWELIEAAEFVMEQSPRATVDAMYKKYVSHHTDHASMLSRDYFARAPYFVMSRVVGNISDISEALAMKGIEILQKQRASYTTMSMDDVFSEQCVSANKTTSFSWTTIAHAAVPEPEPIKDPEPAPAAENPEPVRHPEPEPAVPAGIANPEPVRFEDDGNDAEDDNKSTKPVLFDVDDSDDDTEPVESDGDQPIMVKRSRIAESAVKSYETRSCVHDDLCWPDMTRPPFDFNAILDRANPNPLFHDVRGGMIRFLVCFSHPSYIPRSLISQPLLLTQSPILCRNASILCVVRQGRTLPTEYPCVTSTSIAVSMVAIAPSSQQEVRDRVSA